MPSSFKLVAASCLLSCLASFTKALAIPELQRRQGCSSLEPYDVNCELPYYTDTSMNLTFDDHHTNINIASYNSLIFTNFTIASPNPSASQYVRTFANTSSYLRLHANRPGFIGNGDTAFFKIESFYFGCSAQSPNPSTEKPQNCTLTVDAMCAGPDSDGIEFPDLFTFDYQYAVPAGAKFADLEYVDMKTYGKRWDCFNYTLSAEGPGGKPAVLFVDEVRVVEYEYNPYNS